MGYTKKAQVIQVNLGLSRLGIDGRKKLLSVIAQAAPQSGLYSADPVLKDAADKVIESGAGLEAAEKTLNGAEQSAVTAKSGLVAAQELFDKDLLFFKSAAETKCKTEKELNDLGFNRRSRAASVPLSAPEAIVAKPGKEKGSMIVRAKRVGSISTYAAEISADPIGPSTWQAIPGSGGRRMLAGYVSGARYWVRFKALRANEESPWSEAVSTVAR
jgi:hypothetical protein